MSFLFGAVPIPGTPPQNVMPVVNNNQGNTGDIFGSFDTTKYDRVYKDSGSHYRNNVIGYIGDTIYATDRINQDPYISLLDYFNGSGGGTGSGGDNKHGPPSMTLKAADFVYLRDLGVYPINRLIILRRYRDGVIVPNNLSLFKERPISTVVGWFKVDDSNKELFSFNFGEKWVEQTETLDKVIQKIMKEQFGIRTEMFLPVAGWSQGFLFGMLNKMGLTTYDFLHVPTGDPNVLRQAMMRDTDGQSLLSDLKITFETSYEQKYIDGVDPGLAFQDIIANLARCGTSDMKFILNGNSEAFQTFFKDVLMGGSKDSAQAWVNLGKQLVDVFVSTVKEFFTGLSNTDTGTKSAGNITTSWSGVNDQITTNNQTASNKQAQIDNAQKKLSDLKNQQSQSSHPELYTNNINYWQNRLDNLQGKSSKASPNGIFAGVNLDFSKVSSIFSGVVNTILAGSVYRYRWPLIGSIGLMSGLSTTPWHLTVGNPFSPILNMANIVVNNVDLKFSTELGFQDMPKRVDVTLDIKLARPFGAQEINRMFNNQYGRIYSKPTQVTTNASGISTTSGISNNSTTSGIAPSGYHYEDGVLISDTVGTTNVIAQRTPPSTVVVGRGNNQSSVNLGL